MDQRLLNDVLECSVCLEQLDDTSRVLPCQHTFCLRCLQDIVQSHKELRCPECRVLVTIALENLPTNILLMRILEGIKNTTRCSLGPPGAVSGAPNSYPLQSPLIPIGRGNIFDGPPLTQAPPLPPSTSVSVSSATDSGTGTLERSLGLSNFVNNDICNFSPFTNNVGPSIFMGEDTGSILSNFEEDPALFSGVESVDNNNPLGIGLSRPNISSPSPMTTVGSSCLGVSSVSSNNESSLTTFTYHRQQSTSGPQPCAKALYNYERKEPRDMSFKKGDIINLRKKIDSNWYSGELNGQTGFFPASYVQVLVHLPSHVPQCKALYDFKMTNDEERDCLTFNKGDVITVLRRVDDNWAEGKLGMCIGIFPLSFVDLNTQAKGLMKLSLNASAGPSRIAPPTPTTLIDPPSLLILGESGPPTAQAPPVPTHITDKSSSSSSSVVTSPDPSLTSRTSSPTSPGSHHTSQYPPASSAGPAATPTLRGPSIRKQREKRHSFTAVHSFNPSSPSQSPIASPHRHSLEIISSGADKSGSSGPVGLGAGGLGSSLARNNVSNHATHGGPSDVDSSPLHLRDSSVNTLMPSTEGHTTSSASQVTVTTFFVALYTYRGRKTDELDLRKGYLYTVNEKCQDGWYKGHCITTDKNGVFPGNYVQVAKPGMIAAYLAKRNGRQSSHHHRSSNNSRSNSTASYSSSVSYTRQRQNTSKSPDVKINDAIRDNSRSSSSLPPELPPRSVSAAVDIKSSNLHTTVTSVGTTVPAQHNSQVYSPNNRNVSGISSAVSPPPNVALSEGSPAVTTSPQSSKYDRRWSKERGSGGGGSGGMSLMRKLTSSSKKKSKSPPPTAYSMDNPVFEDNTISPTPGNLHTTHTRSGSCPGTLLGGVAATGLGFGPHSRLRTGGGSCRVSLHERPNLFLTNSMLRRGRSGSNPDNSGVGIKRSDSISSVQTNVDLDNSKDITHRSKQPAPLMRERFRCIVPYPPNGEYELELHQGDIIYVHKKRDDGWYKGTLQRTGKTGLFPASFVESC